MSKDPKFTQKLIEVALPLKEINTACVEDKGIKTGHIRNLHKWFAPMPLPAWRAILYGTVVGGDLGKNKTVQSANRTGHFERLEKILSIKNSHDHEAFRACQKELAKWQREQGEVVIVDPFCGGGSTILEAQRLGFRTIGSDLNAVPVVISKMLTEYPPKVNGLGPVFAEESEKGPGLTGFLADIKFLSNLIKDQAFKKIGNQYPERITPDGGKGVVAAWTWCRIVPCPNPSCGNNTPLATSFILSKQKGNLAKIVPFYETNEKGKKDLSFKIVNNLDEGPNSLKAGRGVNFNCLGCGSLIQENSILAAIKANKMKYQMMSVVVLGKRKKIYIAPTELDRDLSDVGDPDWRPQIKLSRHPQYMSAPRYGVRDVADLYTSRQLLALSTFAGCVRDLGPEIKKRAKDRLPSSEKADVYAEALTTFFAICVSKLTQSNNILVRWKVDSRNGTGKPIPAFDKQVIPIMWDFVEANPFSGAAGAWDTVVKLACGALKFTNPNSIPAQIYQSDAQNLNYLKEVKGKVVLATDPPYYDNIPYADLADVFYPWFRFMLKDFHNGMFETMASPKQNELIADVTRHESLEKAREFFVSGYTNVFKQFREYLRDDTPFSVIYSFTQRESVSETGGSTGWEAMLQALVDAEFQITGTWPVRATMEKRSRDIGSNALGSAIVLVCRPRSHNKSTITRREFLQALKLEMPVALRNLMAANIAPVDLHQACLGPGMAIYSRNDSVIEANGGKMSVGSALSLILQELKDSLSEDDGEYDRDTRWALEWFKLHGFEPGKFPDADNIARGKNTSVEGLVKAGICQSGKGKVQLIPSEKLNGAWDPATDERLTIWEVTHYMSRALEINGEKGAATLLSRVSHLAAPANQLAYRLHVISSRKKWSKLAGGYNALASQWSEIERLSKEILI